MAETPSQLIPLGTRAADFTLTDVVTGRQMTKDDVFKDQVTAVLFMCNHCPYVRHIIDGIVSVSNEYLERKVSFVAISANDATQFPQDGPEMMTAFAVEHGFKFPYLYDETQTVAKAYGATCTPDLFIYDHEQRLAYHGQFDSARPGNDIPVTGDDFRAAFDILLSSDEPVPKEQIPSVGCSIKWK